MSEWPRVSFMEVCDIEGGTQPPKETFRYETTDGYIRMLQIQDFQSDENAVFIPEAGRCKICKEEDVLIARYGASIGRILRGKAGAYNVALVKTVPDLSRIERGFLYQLLRSPGFQTFILSVGSRAAQAGFNKSDLERFQFLLPPLPEQRRIADVLDHADALRAKRRAALAQLDTLTQSIFLDLFGNPATNPKGWRSVAFGELGENQDSQRVPVKSSDRDGRKGQYPYYGASGIIDWVDDYIFNGERLLIGEDGANLVARATPVAYIASGKYWVNNHAHVIAENGRADLRFLEYFIEHSDLKPFISGTAQPKLNRSNLDRISVPLPPLPMQRDFARRVAALEKLKAIHHASLAEMDALFGVLQHRAFRGEL